MSPPTREETRTGLQELFWGAVRLVLECLLEQQVREMVGARRYERLGSRKDYTGLIVIGVGAVLLLRESFATAS